MKKTLLGLVGIAITLVSIIIAFMFYKTINNIIIYSSVDSYAKKYANNNLLRYVEVSDSDKSLYDYDLETFDYNIIDKGIEITNYSGISKRLVIPSYIDGKKVISISKNAISSNEYVKSIVISKNIEKMDIESLNNITIECFNGKYCNELKKNDKLNVIVLNDSDIVNFNNSYVDFTYNISDEVTITNYVGSDNTLVIPSHINGYPVTKLSFDAIYLEAIYIPNTVTSISGNFISKLANTFLVTTIISSIVALTIYLIMLFTNKGNNIKESFYNVPLVIVSIIYLLLIAYVTHLMRINPFFFYRYVVLMITITLIYIILGIVLKIIKVENKKYDEKMSNVGSFNKEVINLLDDSDLDFKDIIEEIKYSDPQSTEMTKEIENTIIDLIEKTSQENLEESKKEISKLIKKRNRIIKDNK